LVTYIGNIIILTGDDCRILENIVTFICNYSINITNYEQFILAKGSTHIFWKIENTPAQLIHTVNQCFKQLLNI
jgi:uncharacterized protein with ACT and thioredoxin-like domain